MDHPDRRMGEGGQCAVNILIPTIGSRGDVQPFIAPTQGLRLAGHQVTLASHPVMRTRVEAHGVPFAPIGPDIYLAREVAALRHRSRNSILGLIRAMRFGFDLLERSQAAFTTEFAASAPGTPVPGRG
jgi:UDP:flavonoid glycosyltransferase YjiC (YdhE family)